MFRWSPSPLLRFPARGADALQGKAGFANHYFDKIEGWDSYASHRKPPSLGKRNSRHKWLCPPPPPRAAVARHELAGKRAERGRRHRLVSSIPGRAVRGSGFGGVPGRRVLGGAGQSPFV